MDYQQANIRIEYVTQILSAIKTYNRVLHLNFTPHNERIIEMLENEIKYMIGTSSQDYNCSPQKIYDIVALWENEGNNNSE